MFLRGRVFAPMVRSTFWEGSLERACLPTMQDSGMNATIGCLTLPLLRYSVKKQTFCDASVRFLRTLCPQYLDIFSWRNSLLGRFLAPSRSLEIRPWGALWNPGKL